jgi:hypothetical protein
MSLIRSLSRRFSRGKEESPKRRRGGNKSVALYDAPVPATRQMTTADLFQANQSSSEQTTNMDRTLYEIPQPNQVDAMTDLIKQHEGGSLFPYVGVVGHEGEGPDARRARLLALKPSYNKRDVPEIKVLGCPLISREGDFTMSKLMDYAQRNTDPVPVTSGLMPSGAHAANYSITKPYVHIRQVTILFTPTVSSTSNYCNLWMNLVDHRLIDSERGSQTNVVVSNQESILEMSCDYCVSKSDLNHFSLSYTLERDIVHPGHQWGAASFYFTVTETDLPYQSSKVDAMAVYRMPITTLMERQTNADKSDISFTPADIVKLRELYKSGDIVDVDEPQKSRLKTNTYSKSSIRTAPKGEAINVPTDPGWSFMKDARKQKVDAEVASVDPSDEGDEDLPEVDLEAARINRQAALARYKESQEAERTQFIPVETVPVPHELKEREPIKEVFSSDEDDEPNELSKFFGGSKKKVQFGASNV